VSSFTVRIPGKLPFCNRTAKSLVYQKNMEILIRPSQFHAQSYTVRGYRAKRMRSVDSGVHGRRHRVFLRLVISSARSASFLGTFVCLFWYAVCLTRTRLGPSLFPKIDPIQWEKLCVKAGCIACGWSVMIENPRRRAEMMFFVTPRALATLLPRRYDVKYQWIESLVFALSTGVLLTAARHRPHRIRGVFGKLLEAVVAT